MACFKQPDGRDFVQPFDVPEFFVSGMAHCELMQRGIGRATFFIDRTILEGPDRRSEAHVNVALIGPIVMLATIRAQLQVAQAEAGWGQLWVPSPKIAM